MNGCSLTTARDDIIAAQVAVAAPKICYLILIDPMVFPFISRIRSDMMSWDCKRIPISRKIRPNSKRQESSNDAFSQWRSIVIFEGWPSAFGWYQSIMAD